MTQTSESNESDGARLAGWARSVEPSPLQLMLTLASRPGVTSFALGLPAPELFPTAALARAAERVLSAGGGALQYAPHFGPLRAQVVELMRRRGVECREEQIFLTAGAQQGMNMLARLLLEQGGSVLTEELIYTGFRQVLEPFRPEILTVPTDRAAGIDVDAVERHLAGGARPAFIYSITEGHNPLGVSTDPAARGRLVGLARRYRVPVVEDDAYGFLHYGADPPPPLRALDDEWVLYVGTFSKILAPALRVGWLVVPERLVKPLSIVKEATDIDTTTFTQRVVSAYLDGGGFDAHLSTLLREYGARRDAMLRALRAGFPAGASWNAPSSGMFVWVELPERFDAATLFREAVERERVAFIPGAAFAAGGAGAGSRGMRLNFSRPSAEVIEEGVPRLGRLLTEQERAG